MVDMQR